MFGFLGSEDFWSNTVSNLIGTFVGAGLALLSAWGVAKRGRTHSEIAGLQQIIDRLGRSRAFVPDQGGVVRTAALNADEQAEFRRVMISVFILRDLIERVVNSLDPKRNSVKILNEMYIDILNYLNATEIDSCDYRNKLMQLRGELVDCENRLKNLHSKLTLHEPGKLET